MSKTRNRATDGGPNPVDRHVGHKIKDRRLALGMSQEALGKRIALTFQQIQKYERGNNRVSASRMYDLCRALEVPAGYFFEGLDISLTNTAQVIPGLAEESTRELLELSKVCRNLPDGMLYKLIGIAKIMASCGKPVVDFADAPLTVERISEMAKA